MGRGGGRGWSTLKRCRRPRARARGATIPPHRACRAIARHHVARRAMPPNAPSSYDASRASLRGASLPPSSYDDGGIPVSFPCARVVAPPRLRDQVRIAPPRTAAAAAASPAADADAAPAIVAGYDVEAAEWLGEPRLANAALLVTMCARVLARAPSRCVRSERPSHVCLHARACLENGLSLSLARSFSRHFLLRVLSSLVLRSPCPCARVLRRFASRASRPLARPPTSSSFAPCFASRARPDTSPTLWTSRTRGTSEDRPRSSSRPTG